MVKWWCPSFYQVCLLSSVGQGQCPEPDQYDLETHCSELPNCLIFSSYTNVLLSHNIQHLVALIDPKVLTQSTKNTFSSAHPGTSVGSFIYATAQNELIALYGLDGCLLIIGAVALNLMACAGFMRPLNMPGYYLKQKAALERNTEEQILERPPLEDLKITSGSTATTPEKTVMMKELFITMDDKDIQMENKKGSSPSGLAIMKAIKKKQQAYSKYIHSMYEILQDRAMTAFCIAVFLFSLGAFPPVLFIEDVAQSQGLIEEVSVIPLVSIGAIATCVGKLVLGILVDIRWMNGIYLYSFTMFAAGLSLLLIPIIKSYLGLQILCVILGFFSGNWSLTSYITTRIVGLERLTQAHGILMFFGGLGIMLGPPVVGKRACFYLEASLEIAEVVNS